MQALSTGNMYKITSLFTCAQNWMSFPPPFPGVANYSGVLASTSSIVIGQTSNVNINALLMCGFQGVIVNSTVNTRGCNQPTSPQLGGGGSNTNGDGSGAGHGGPGGA